MSELMRSATEELKDIALLDTVSPDVRAAAIRETLTTLASNVETLAAELRDIVAAADEFASPEIPISWMVAAEQKFATGVRCIARSAGLVAAE